MVTLDDRDHEPAPFTLGHRLAQSPQAAEFSGLEAKGAVRTPSGAHPVADSAERFALADGTRDSNTRRERDPHDRFSQQAHNLAGYDKQHNAHDQHC